MQILSDFNGNGEWNEVFTVHFYIYHQMLAC